MLISPLKQFNRHSVEELIAEGTDMRYDHNHSITEHRNIWGEWNPIKNIIYINPTVKHRYGKAVEDHTIVHEWLHVYEDLRLDPPRSFRDAQIDWWAYYHLRQDALIAGYIRGFFKQRGF